MLASSTITPEIDDVVTWAVKYHKLLRIEILVFSCLIRLLFISKIKPLCQENKMLIKLKTFNKVI